MPTANRNEINGYFRQFAGRDASPGELDFLSKYIDQGELSPGEVGMLVQGLPDSRARILEQQTPQLDARLAAGDQASLNATMAQAVPQINSRLASLGRQNSSAFEGALAQQIGQQGYQLAAQRQNTLAQFYGGGLSNIANLYTQLSQGAQNRGYQVRDANTQRGFDLQNFDMQRNSYNDYLNMARSQQRGQGFGQLAGMALGGGLGAFYGGPTGAMVGARIGGSAGGSAGGLF